MSVFNIKSTVIANRDATPKVLTDSIFATARSKEVYGTNLLPTTSDVASTVKLCAVPSRARVAALDYTAVALGTSSLDIAVWYPTTIQSGGGNFLAQSLAGTLISSSAFATAIAGVDTGLAFTDGLPAVTAANALPKRTQPLWQFLGLATDPEMDLDLGFSVRTTNSISGYVGLRVRFVD